MKQHLYDFWHSPTATWIKGGVGTSVPVFGLTFHIDTWATAIQASFGFMIPFLTGVSLYYDIRRKRRIENTLDKDERHKEYLRDYFRQKRAQKKRKKKKEPLP